MSCSLALADTRRSDYSVTYIVCRGILHNLTETSAEPEKKILPRSRHEICILNNKIPLVRDFCKAVFTHTDRPGAGTHELAMHWMEKFYRHVLLAAAFT